MEIIIVLLGIVIDRITKVWSINNLANKPEKVIIKDFFSFSYLENRGAAFGIFQHKIIFLTLITLIIIGFIIFYIIKYKPKSKLLRLSLAMVISGAIGNLIDRIYYKYVVDFILFHYKDLYYFPTFNVADILVVCGTILLSICILRDEK